MQVSRSLFDALFTDPVPIKLLGIPDRSNAPNQKEFDRESLWINIYDLAWLT